MVGIRLILCALFLVVGTAQAAEPTTSRTAAEVRWRELVVDYLTWKPQAVDQPNPHRNRIVAEGSEVVPHLLEMGDGGPMNIRVIWILGEIGSRRAFPALLSEYLARPSTRTAISLGSCLGKPEVEYLFSTDAISGEELRALLVDVYGQGWPTVSSKSQDELKADLLQRLNELRETNRRRSRPMIG
jgi:hypothetical protein